jgi:hypothetical protein
MSQFNQLNFSMDSDEVPDEDMLYNDWVNKVERIVYASLQMYLDDLPDENYRVNFDDGMSPEDMAKIIITPFNNLITETVGKLFN